MEFGHKRLSSLIVVMCYLLLAPTVVGTRYCDHASLLVRSFVRSLFLLQN